MVALSAGAEDAASTSADDLQLAEQRWGEQRGLVISKSGRHGGSVGAGAYVYGRSGRSSEDQDAVEQY